jgi:predicted HTH domain antitoxin
MMLQAKYFVDTKRYQDEEAVIQDALRHLLRARPELRIQMAVFRYQHEGISLAKAANLAGVSWAQMKDILLEQGIAPRLGVETLEDAHQDVDALRKELEVSS